MILEIIILLLAIPIGLLLAWISKDELKDGRIWFKILIMLSLFGGIFFFLLRFSVIGLTLLFIFIVTIISYLKSFDGK
ncbi:hypothetical protein HYW75_01095 [Candidatus Pacearchaeota archaeon]|nr:hypothetical protein [Candidatus Pacearchaeota archaeon]